MGRGALEIETIAGAETMVFMSAEPDFKFAAENVEKFLAFVRVGFAGAATGLDAKEMRLHDSVAPGKKLHANPFFGFEDLAIGGTDAARIVLGRFEEGKNIGAVIASDAAKSSDGSTHLATFERAEKADRDAGGTSNLRERETATLAKAAKALSGRERIFGGSGNDALTFEDVHDGSGIEMTHATEEDGALKEAYVFFGEKAIAALRAVRRNEAERFPIAQCGRGDADTARDFADTKEPRRHARS
jgi:hypothetical protein